MQGAAITSEGQQDDNEEENRENDDDCEDDGVEARDGVWF